MRQLAALALVALMATATSCYRTTERDEPLDVVSMDEAVHRVHDRVLAVADHLDVPLNNPRRGPVACSDPSGRLSETVYRMAGNQRLRVGADRMTETMHTMRAYFTEHGFDVRDIRWLEDGSGQLRATDPDRFRFSLRPTESRTAYVFSVSSPCYQAPDGESPTDGSWRAPPGMVWDDDLDDESS